MRIVATASAAVTRAAAYRRSTSSTIERHAREHGQRHHGQRLAEEAVGELRRVGAQHEEAHEPAEAGDRGGAQRP